MRPRVATTMERPLPAPSPASLPGRTCPVCGEPASMDARVCGACHASLGPPQRGVLATPRSARPATTYEFVDYHSVRVGAGIATRVRRRLRLAADQDAGARLPLVVAAAIDGLLAASATSLLLAAGALASSSLAGFLGAHVVALWIDVFVAWDVLLRAARLVRGMPTMGLDAAGQGLPPGRPRALWALLPSPVNAVLAALGLWAIAAPAPPSA